jgi:hypothetical protein
MFKKYNNWYRSLTPLKQLIVSFTLNWFLWLIVFLIGEMILFDEQRSWGYRLFYATWMSFFMTIPSNWKKLKSIFKAEKGNSTDK